MARRNYNKPIPDDYEAPLKYAAFHLDWAAMFDFYPDEVAASLTRAILKYVKNGTVPDLEGVAGAQFNSWREQIDADLERNRKINFKREQREQHNGERRARRASAQEGPEDDPESTENGADLGEYKGERESEIINDKSETINYKIQSQNRQRGGSDSTFKSAITSHPEKTREEDDLEWMQDIDLSDEEKRRAFIGYMLWRLRIAHPVDRYAPSMAQDYSVDGTPELMICSFVSYLYGDSAISNSVDFDEAGKIFNKWKEARDKKGLPVFPKDWTCEIEELFQKCGIKQSRGVAFYDSADYPRHSFDNAISWICEEYYNGTKSPQELRRDLEREDRENQARRFRVISNESFTEKDVREYCALMGYNYVDARKVSQQTITKTHWTKYVDICEQKGAEKERED